MAGVQIEGGASPEQLVLKAGRHTLSWLPEVEAGLLHMRGADLPEFRKLIKVILYLMHGVGLAA